MSVELKEYILQFDGGCNPTNPGPASYGFIIYELINEILEPIFAGGNFIGIKTNNYAEYSGVLNGLNYFKNNLYNISERFNLKIQGDSKLVIEQLKGKWKINSENLIELNKECKQIINELKLHENIIFIFEHIYRKYNDKADSICNYCIDNKRNYEEIFLN